MYQFFSGKMLQIEILQCLHLLSNLILFLNSINFMLNLNKYCRFRRTKIPELRNKFICIRYRCFSIPNHFLLNLITLIIHYIQTHNCYRTSNDS